jgi:nucleoside-diphosphate-sugar epimerase
MFVVTGASGFAGAKMVVLLLENGCTVRAPVRSESSSLPAEVKQFLVGDIALLTDWREAVLGAEVVVHLAACVHVRRDATADPVSKFRRVHSPGTLLPDR